MQGIVAERHGKQCRVLLPGDDREHLCPIRPGAGQPVVGDRVEVNGNRELPGAVSKILPRDNVLSRVIGGKRHKALAANVDVMLVVFAPRPNASSGLIDHYLVAAHLLNARAILISNKSDLPAPPDYTDMLDRYRALGYPLLSISTATGSNLEQLTSQLDQQLAVMVGQSGVGKSSLLNQLRPGTDSETQTLSASTGLGRHTTSSATLYRLNGGGMLVDSPGVRSFELGDVHAADAAAAFAEFRPLIGQCRFPNCTHLHEPDCAIRQALTDGDIDQKRYDSYRRIVKAPISHQ